MYKILFKMDKNFLRYSIFFHHGHTKREILIKCRETFQKFFAAWNSSKKTDLPQFFSKISDKCILRTSIC